MSEAWIFPIDAVVAFWVFVIGLCVGSFLNVVILRSFSGESIVLPPSKCPNCNNKLKWWMNIPVLSYLFLRGKCHFCKKPISIQYPVVELINGFLYLILFLSFSYSPGAIFFAIAFSVLLVMSVCDIKEQVIFDHHAYILIGTGIVYNLLLPSAEGILESIIGAAGGFFLFEILARSGYLFAKQRAFGEGDSLIAAGIGAFFGWELVLVSAVVSIFIMALFTFPYFFVHSYRTGKKRTCAGLFVSIVLIALAYFLPKTALLETFWASLGFLFFLIAGTIWCVIQILSDMKKKDENGEASLCMLPFGPAMAISFVLIVLFLQNADRFAGISI